MTQPNLDRDGRVRRAGRWIRGFFLGRQGEEQPWIDAIETAFKVLGLIGLGILTYVKIIKPDLETKNLPPVPHIETLATTKVETSSDRVICKVYVQHRVANVGKSSFVSLGQRMTGQFVPDQPDAGNELATIDPTVGIRVISLRAANGTKTAYDDLETAVSGSTAKNAPSDGERRKLQNRHSEVSLLEPGEDYALTRLVVIDAPAKKSGTVFINSSIVYGRDYSYSDVLCSFDDDRTGYCSYSVDAKDGCKSACLKALFGAKNASKNVSVVVSLPDCQVAVSK